jgi:hypothetical protein
VCFEVWVGVWNAGTKKMKRNTERAARLRVIKGARLALGKLAM